ncbi:MAG: hypothetical protein KGJ88_07870 [Verrucomicrobiota bacterium]|nr:hypothetical protein [Verrucomicrobiota bacterium]
MSMTYWPVELAQWIAGKFNYKSGVLTCPTADLPALFKTKLAGISFEDFVRGLTVSEAGEDL